jgi:glycosyltransferase involved in cell wall biosynthesis
MHVLLIHQAFAALDEAGGTRHHEIARYLNSRGYQVTIIASPISYLTGKSQEEQPTEDVGQESADDIKILHAYTYSALHRSFVHRVFSFLSFMISSFFIGVQVRDVDLVWGTSPPIFQSLTAWVLARLKRVPFLLEIRDLWPAFAIAIGVLRQPGLIMASEWLERFLYRNADCVVVNSPGFIDHVQSAGAIHVELVPNGTDADMFNPQAKGVQFRRANGLGERFIALYAGAHGISNDLGIVLSAAKILQEQNSKILFVLIGDGKEKPALENQAEDLALDNLIFLPPAPKNEMPEVLAAADACIAILKPIALYATVYPNKVFDYMAAGRPVVLAMEGVIREVVEKAKAGISIPPGNPNALANAIKYLVNHPEERRSLGFKGNEYVKNNFNRIDQADKLGQIIEQMVNGNKV